jgi:DNA-binding IclR family transcriptional regulator
VPAVASPVAARAAQLLKVLAAAPERELPLSEIARRLGVNRASCQTLLLALVAEGLVARRGTSAVRSPGPTYRLGAGLIHLGETARASLDVSEIAGAHLDALHQRFAVTAMVGVPSSNEIVVTAVRATPHPLGLTVVTGGRTPLRAPIGTVYVAWAPSAEIDAWIARAAPPLSRNQGTRVRRSLAAIRRRGYSVTVLTPRRSRDEPTHEELLDENEDLQRAEVLGVSAPVWDAGGAMACSLALTGFAGGLTTRELHDVSAAVREAAADVTGILGGRAPQPTGRAREIR